MLNTKVWKIIDSQEVSEETANGIGFTLNYIPIKDSQIHFWLRLNRPELGFYYPFCRGKCFVGNCKELRGVTLHPNKESTFPACVKQEDLWNLIASREHLLSLAEL